MDDTVEGESLDQVLGRWRVVNVEKTISSGAGAVPSSSVQTELAGVEFVLDEHGDVTWYLPAGVESDELFLASSYQIADEDIKFFDIGTGSSYKFTIELGPGLMRLRAKLEQQQPYRFVYINCSQIQEAKRPPPLNYQLLAAMEEGFFSDLTIRSDDGHQFKVHRVILASRLAGMKYRDWEMLLSGKPQDILRTVLHYVYTDALPGNLKEAAARQVQSLAGSRPQLGHLLELCNRYLDKYALKTTITDIITEVHHRIDSIRAIVVSMVLSDPAKLVYAIHQITKEVGIIIIKFVVLCETFLQRKSELTKAERKEVLEYSRGRVPMFLDQAREVLEIILEKWQTISAEHKNEIAQYLIPEVSRVWELLSTIVVDGKEALSRVSSLVQKDSKKRSKKVSEVLYLVSHVREMKMLKKMKRQLEGGSSFIELILSKDKFDVLEDNAKVGRLLQSFTSIERSMVQAVKQLQNAKKMILVENVLEWRRWKLYVSHVTYHLAWIMSKLRLAGDSFKPVAIQVCQHIGQKSFNECVVSLGLLTDKEVPQGDDDITIASVGGAAAAIELSSNVLKMCTQLPAAGDSQLAMAMGKLVETQEYSDMQFILPPTSPQDPPLVVPAHRAIVAARCEYFCRALQSGMKEAIDRKIVIQNMDQAKFQSFLHFLYSGILDTASMPLDEVVEMLTIADGYEMVSLKTHCEMLLLGMTNDSTAFGLLAVADHYSALKLREKILGMVVNRADLVGKEEDSFSALPDELRAEILAMMKDGDAKMTGTPSVTTAGKKEAANSPPSTPPDLLDSFDSSSSDSHTPSVASDSFEPAALMASAIEELRNIVGADPADELLSELLLAADMDINRAVNFYYNIAA